MKDTGKLFLSIIVPIYNGAEYIDALIEMVRRQEFHDMELILVDDGSSDNTYELCRKQADMHNWIRVIHTDNHGVSHARNTGLDSARGEWIQFVDVDDVIAPEMMQSFYNTVLNHDKTDCEAYIDKSTDLASHVKYPEKKTVASGIDIIICGCNRIHDASDCVPCGPKENRILTGCECKKLFDKLEMEDRYWLLDYCWNKWYKKEILERKQIRFDEKLSLGEDFVFNAQYMKYVKSIALLKACYYQYRVGEDGLASRFQSEPWNSRRFLYEAQKELYQSWGLWESNWERIHFHYGQILFGDIRTINSKKCRLTQKEKQQYLKTMVESPLFSMILHYLKEKKSMIFEIYHLIFSWKKERWILALIQLEGKMKK